MLGASAQGILQCWEPQPKEFFSVGSLSPANRFAVLSHKQSAYTGDLLVKGSLIDVPVCVIIFGKMFPFLFVSQSQLRSTGAPHLQETIISPNTTKGA